jgi:hypothetical protein
MGKSQLNRRKRRKKRQLAITLKIGFPMIEYPPPLGGVKIPVKPIAQLAIGIPLIWLKAKKKE